MGPITLLMATTDLRRNYTKETANDLAWFATVNVLFAPDPAPYGAARHGCVRRYTVPMQCT